MLFALIATSGGHSIILSIVQTIEGVSYSVLPVPWRIPVHTEMEMVVPADAAEQVNRIPDPV